MVYQQAHGLSITAFKRTSPFQGPIVINSRWEVVGELLHHFKPWQHDNTGCLGKARASRLFKFCY